MTNARDIPNADDVEIEELPFKNESKIFFDKLLLDKSDNEQQYILDACVRRSQTNINKFVLYLINEFNIFSNGYNVDAFFVECELRLLKFISKEI